MIKETDLAKVVISNISDAYVIYKEVDAYKGRCDIVALSGKIQWGIEIKSTLGIPVLEQAYNWLGAIHYVSVATPTMPGKLCKNICRSFGIGCIYINAKQNGIEEIIPPKFFRKAKGLKLHEEQKYWCDAGSQSGGYFTPFKRTVNSLTNEIKKHPNGLEVSRAIRAIETHYKSMSTAKSCLVDYIKKGIIPGLKLKKVKKNLVIYFEEEKKGNSNLTIQCGDTLK